MVCKRQLVDKSAENLGMTNKDTERVVNEFLNNVISGLRHDGKVEIYNFCSLTKVSRQARKGYDPARKEPQIIPAHYAVKIRQGKKLRECVQE